MALPLLLIFYAGRIIPIGIRIGTALARFAAKNPKRAVPIPTTIGITLPIFATKNTGRTILLFYYILHFIYYIIS